MNASERQKWLCQQCGKPQQCEYVDRGFENLCPAIQETMQGWQLGYKDAIEKAVEWIKQFAYNSVITDHVGEREKQAIIIAFKQAMEEQK